MVIVGYMGTVTPPMIWTAKSTKFQAGRFPEIIAILSPGFTLRAKRPKAKVCIVSKVSEVE